jgi:hypothetical protein
MRRSWFSFSKTTEYACCHLQVHNFAYKLIHFVRVYVDIMHQTAVLLFQFQNVNICQQHQVMVIHILKNSNAGSVHGNCSFIAEVSLTAGAKRFFSCPQHPDRLQGPPSLLSKWYNTPSPEVQIWPFILLLRSRMVELYLCSPICLHGIVLNYIINSGITLPLPYPIQSCKKLS